MSEYLVQRLQCSTPAETKGSTALFYTPQLYFSYDPYDFYGESGGDYNLENSMALSGRRIWDQKLSTKNLKALMTQLRKFGFSEEANYLNTIHLIDNMKGRPADTWDQPPTGPDSIGLLQVIKDLQQKITTTKNDWLRNRYAFTVLKAQAFAHRYADLITAYPQYKALFSSSSILADLSQSLYAGAFYHNKDRARSYHEFSQLLTERPRLAFRAVKNIRVYNMVFDPAALRHCKNDAEKANLYAMNCLKPYTDIPGNLRQIVQYNPNHPHLQLIVSRMINKYEEYVHQDQTPQEERWEMGDSTAYYQSPARLDSILQLTKGLATLKQNEQESFYALATAYLYYLKGDFLAAKAWTKQAYPSKDVYLERQRKILETLLMLNPSQSTANMDEWVLLNKIKSIGKMAYGRDVHVMQTVGDLLSRHYRTQPDKQFFSRSLAAISTQYNWENDQPKPAFECGGFEQQLYLDTMSTDKLKTAVLFIEAKSKSKSDSLLIQLSGLTPDELHLAYARRLMLDYRWEEAQIYFQKISKQYRDNRLNGVNALYGYGEKLSSFSAPKLWLKSDRTSKIADFDVYLSKIIGYKKAVDGGTTDPLVHYNLSLAILNVSYWGEAWILSKSKRSSAEDPKEMIPVVDVANYYQCDRAYQLAATGRNKVKNNPELYGKFTYLLALLDKYRFQTTYLLQRPSNYWAMDEQQEAAFEAKMSGLQAEKYSGYALDFVKNIDNSAYQKMVIEACDDLRKLK